MEIIANCQYGEERAKQFFRFHMLVKSPTKYIYWGLSLTSLAFGGYLIAKNENYFGIFCLFIAVITIVVWLSTVHTSINKIMKELRFPMIKYQLIFSGSTLGFKQGDILKEYAWNQVLLVCETKTTIYFYVTKDQALILGKYILSDQERSQLHTWIADSHIKYRQYQIK